MGAASNLVQRLVNSIADRGRTFLNSLSRTPIEKLCQDLVSERGQASGTAIALEISNRYRAFGSAEQLRFFEGLLGENWLADPEAILRLAHQYHARPDAAALAKLVPVVEPRRVELFRRINTGLHGTAALVNLRRDLLALLPEHPRLEPINGDLVHLFSSWFNRGFLELRRIDWRTPALVLEKLMAHEAVHEIHGWPDLRRRLERDRRCFAFFHAALPDQPLIFVEVALTRGIARAIQPLIDVTTQPGDPGEADTAVFYSISNCLDGLRNISFGAFLIKQVVQELQNEDLRLKNFVTLSPIPQFREWLESQRSSLRSPLELRGGFTRAALSDGRATKSLRPELLRMCARYLTTRRPDGRAYDPVAALHMSNGASIEHINWLGDLSERGIRQSLGLMVNYAYQPARIERNHEQYVKQGRFAMSDEVRSLLEEPKGPRPAPAESGRTGA
ncbi:MAG TPA: malonyl-CoA decarboxylase family protein [Bryobacteraceae bacterium]|nr:malonyl-CoA decarboxylase family protein [Bryobacteraceae bacterium]